MYKIKAFFSSPNYSSAVNRTQQLTEIKTKKKCALKQSSLIIIPIGESV